MALAYSWETFTTIHGDEAGARNVFEKLIRDLLQVENPKKEVHRVEAAQGDGGVDCYIQKPEGIDVYQCKYFMGKMTPDRWGQVEKSFERIMKYSANEGLRVLSWTLCLPRIMRKEDILKFGGMTEKWRKDHILEEITFLDGDEIIRRMEECDCSKKSTMIDRYFIIPMTKRRYPKCLTPSIPMGPEIGLIGRSEIVEKIREILDSGKEIALVSGLGGIGKTAVMQKVCDEIRQDGDDTHHVAWIICGESLVDDLMLLRGAFGIPKELKKEESFAAIIREVQNPDGILYLFLDNMNRNPTNEELGILNALSSSVRLMITSRHGIKGMKKVELEHLEQANAVEMFYGYYERDEERRYEKDAWGIINADSVRSHTLLVELLAKAANAEFGTLADFRRNLEEKGFFEVYKQKLDTEHDENMTIEESVRKLYDISELSEEQKKILRLFTIFSPEKSIYHEIQDWAELDRNALQSLIKLGWLERTDTGFLIHQIIRDSLVRQVGDNLKIEEYGELLNKVIDTESYMSEDLVYTVVQERLVMAEDVVRHLEKRVKGLVEAGECLEKAGELLIDLSTLFNNLAGVVYSKQGDYEKALEYYGKDIDIKERVFGTEHPVTATLYNDIGMVYKYQGNYEKALKYYEKALAIREQVLGTQHPTTAITYNNLAAVYEDQGYYEKAQEYYEKALAIYEKVRGTEHPNIAIMYNNLAGVNYYLGDYEKALEYYGKALVIYEQVHGTEDSTTANMYNNLAGVYKDQGDYEKALEYFGKALAIREQVLGTEHPSTAATYNNLALVYIDQGDYEKALEYFGKALAICEQVLGTDHPTTATTYNNLTGVYIAQGDYKKALDCLGKALAIDERVFGFDHPATASMYNNLAVVYAYQDDYENALEYYGKTIAILERVFGADHPSTATTYYNIAWIYCKLGDYIKALDYYEKALRIRLEKLGANHPHTQDTQKWIEWVRTHMKSEK